MSAIELPARPLRFDKAQLLIPVVMLPGLAMAAVHAPVALLTFGPLVLTSWVLSRRDRFFLDRCTVRIEGPALELRYKGRRLDAVDLRYAARQQSRTGDMVLSEGDSSYLAFGTDPPDNAYPISQEGDLVPVVTWRAVRLLPGHFQELCAALTEVQKRDPPDTKNPAALLEAVGSVGVWGRRAEALLARYLLGDDSAQGGRPGGILTAIKELSLRQDRVGLSARRVLLQAGKF